MDQVVTLVLVLFMAQAVAQGGHDLRLMQAVQAGDVVAAETEIAAGALLDPICGPYEICKPLFFAAEAGNVEIVRLLLEAGADPNGTNAYDDTAFIATAGLAHSAGIQGAPHEIMVLLLDHGADPNQPNSFGVSPLVALTSFGDIGLLELALIRGGDLSLSHRGITPLNFAAQHGSAETVQWMLDRGADPAFRNEQGMTARDVAVEYKNTSVLRILEGL